MFVCLCRRVSATTSSGEMLWPSLGRGVFGFAARPYEGGWGAKKKNSASGSDMGWTRGIPPVDRDLASILGVPFMGKKSKVSQVNSSFL